MRKILTLGLTALTASTVLAFASPIAANAGPNTDSFCVTVSNNNTNLNADLTNARTADNDAIARVVARTTDLDAATTRLVNSAAVYVASLDTVNPPASAKADFDADTAAFTAAASTWLDAHIAEVNTYNTVTGKLFLLRYVAQVSNDVCGTGFPVPALPDPSSH